MSYRYTWQGDTGAAHPILGELVTGHVYTSHTELVGPGWAAYSETKAAPSDNKPNAVLTKPGKEKIK